MADDLNGSRPAEGPGVQHRPVDPRLEPALVSLARAGLTAAPKELVLRDVIWGGLPAPGVSRIEVGSDGSLSLRAEPPSKAAIVQDPTAWTPECFKAEVDEHGTLEITQGLSPLVHLSLGSIGSHATASLRGWRWRALSGRAALLWVTRLEFASPQPPVVLSWNDGNMVLAVDGAMVRAWRFDTGHGQAFLVPNGADWYLAVEAGPDAQPDVQLIELVRSVVGFVLGEPVGLELFRPVGAAGQEPGLAHVSVSRQKERRTAREPPSLPFGCAPTWIAGFADALFRLAHDVPEAPLLRALGLYFASLSGFLESNFLHAWVGVETLASWRIASDRTTDGGPQRLADHAAWLSWVKAHKKEIESLATPGFEESLLGRVQSAGDGSPSKVQRVFRGLGIQWTAEMDDAEKVRNGVVHEGAMRGPDRDWERDRARVGLVKTMLTALLAKLAGYRGPLADRSKTCSNIASKDEPAWWPAELLGEHLDHRGAGVDAIAAANDEKLRRLRAELPADDDSDDDDDGAT